MATKATLINSAGNKVVVESGSQQAQQYFSQGYQLMGSSGKYVAPATTSAPAATPTPTPTPVVQPLPVVSQPAATPVQTPVASSPSVQPVVNTPAAPTPASNPQSTLLYYKDGTTNEVPNIDVSYWKTQGWSTEPIATPAAAPVVKTPENNAATPATENISSIIDPSVLAKPGIANLVASGVAFNETDAKNFAFANGDSNYQQYIGGVGGKTNPLYIGSTNWANLQKQYTPYQLAQSTTKTKDGIYWNPNVNIAEVPREDPINQINSDAKKLAEIVSGAKSEADKFSNEAAKTAVKPELSSDTKTNESSLMAMLQNTYGDSAETIYNDLFNTPDMRAAQSEVNDLKGQLDEYDQQMEELKDDVRREVEGEASDSYISALATVRGEKILKLKRSTQRDYDTALANYNGLKENATNLLTVRTKDAETRYNRLFSMLQLQIQQEGTAFNQEVALANIAMSIPEGRSMTISGQTIKGLKENDNLNVVQFTDASGKTYVIGVDKKTGAQTYKTYIGTSKVAGSGTAEKAVDLQTALYWLSLVKNKDGGYDLNSIPADIRTGVVNVISQNKDKLPTPEKTWWERQKEDVSSGNIWSAINPFD